MVVAPDIRNGHYLVENQLARSGLISPKPNRKNPDPNVQMSNESLVTEIPDIVNPHPVHYKETEMEAPGLWIHNHTVHVPFNEYCAPLRNQSSYDQNNWRNKVMLEVLQQVDPKHQYIKIAKFFEITAGRHDIHLRGGDCTHYCHFPMIWIPVYTEIYRILHDDIHGNKKDDGGKL